MDVKKILVALVIVLASIGLTGVATASIYDAYMSNSQASIYDAYMSSYAYSSIDYSSTTGGTTSSVSEEYSGTHTSDFSASGITTHTAVTIYPSKSSLYDAYYSSYTSITKP